MVVEAEEDDGDDDEGGERRGKENRKSHALARACTKRSLRATSSALVLCEWR